jgi:hypothetical protein
MQASPNQYFTRNSPTMNLLPEPHAPKPLFHPLPLCSEYFSRNINAINLLANHSPRNQLIPSHLLINHSLCMFSL